MPWQIALPIPRFCEIEGGGQRCMRVTGLAYSSGDDDDKWGGHDD